MKVEVIKLPQKTSRANPHWLEVFEKFSTLLDDECLKVEGLVPREINALRQRAYREEHARCFTRREGTEIILYLYKTRRN